jgi:hypothetical protein
VKDKVNRERYLKRQLRLNYNVGRVTEYDPSPLGTLYLRISSALPVGCVVDPDLATDEACYE